MLTKKKAAQYGLTVIPTRREALGVPVYAPVLSPSCHEEGELQERRHDHAGASPRVLAPQPSRPGTAAHARMARQPRRQRESHLPPLWGEPTDLLPLAGPLRPAPLGVARGSPGPAASGAPAHLVERGDRRRAPAARAVSSLGQGQTRGAAAPRGHVVSTSMVGRILRSLRDRNLLSAPL